MRFDSRLLSNARVVRRAGLALLLVASPAVAQEEDEAPVAQSISIVASSSVEGDGEGGAPKMAISFATPTMSFSLGGTPDDPLDPSGMIDLLQQEAIRQELKISDEQIAGIRKLQQKSSKVMQEAISSLKFDAPKPSANGEGGALTIPKIDTSGLKEKIQSAREQVTSLNADAVEQILLPGQLDRIRQIAHQVELTKLGLGPALTRGRLGKEIGVRPEQKPDLIRLAQKLDEETQAKILELKRKAREELLASLDPEQAEKAKEILGDYFDYKPPTMDDFTKQFQSRVRKPAGEEVKAESADTSKVEEKP